MMYVEDAQFAHAAFCGEQLLFLEPGVPEHALLYADLCAARGALGDARAYYATVHEAAPTSIRALLG